MILSGKQVTTSTLFPRLNFQSVLFCLFDDIAARKLEARIFSYGILYGRLSFPVM